MNNNTRTREQITGAIMAYFRVNRDTFNDCIEELDSYNGFLGDDRYYYMEDLDELYNNETPSEVLCRAFYGYDEDTTYTDDHGTTIYGSFNPNRDFFKFNAYGNLVSSDYKDYSDRLDSYAIESMSDNRRYIDSIDRNMELSELFDELEEAN